MYLILYKNKIPLETPRDLRLCLYHLGITRIKINETRILHINDSLSTEELIDELGKIIEKNNIKLVITYSIYNIEIKKYLDATVNHVTANPKYCPEFYLQTARLSYLL